MTVIFTYIFMVFAMLSCTLKELEANTSTESTSERINATTPKPGICFTWKGTHYETFDGRVYSFASKCAHVLVRDRIDYTFSVVVQNHPNCLTSPSQCSKIIRVYYGGEMYTLKHSEEDGQLVFSSTKRRLPIPGQVPGLRVRMSAQFITLSLDTVGLTMRWNGRQTLQVEAQKSLWGRTEGLCGRLDGNDANDMVDENGNSHEEVTDLANSWKIEEEKCDDPPSDSHSCSQNINDPKSRNASNVCNSLLLKNQRLDACQHVIDSFSVLDACRRDYCSCEHSDPKSCVCETVSVYVKTCTYNGVEDVVKWRDENTCPMLCTGGRVYRPCGPPSGQPVCGSSVEETEEGNCVEGCYCPEGTVLYEDECIARDKCPCTLHGQSYQPGAQVQQECNVCTCRNGKWKCTDDNCDRTCTVWGDPHYTTFDGKKYDFMGKCSYYLVKTDSLSIEVKNQACLGIVQLDLPKSVAALLPSCTKTVTVRYAGQTVKLKQKHEVTVNGKEVAQIPYEVANITIRRVSSIYLQVDLPNGMQVRWDGVSCVHVHVPGGFEEKTAGLCGTFNYNQKDDFLTPEGDVEHAVVPFADKWKSSETCGDGTDEPPSKPCEVHVQKRPTAEKHCGVIKSALFSPCHVTVDPEQYYQDCLYDMCSCGNHPLATCLCPTVATYADECADKGVKIEWRAEVGECAVRCSGGQQYRVCGDSCTRSCRDLSSRADCKSRCVEGCNCPEGEALNEKGECVAVDKCKCEFEGHFFEPGFKGVRSGHELCTCVDAVWSCHPATPKEKEKYPSIIRKNRCNETENMVFSNCEPEQPVTCKNMHSPNYFSASVCHPGCVCEEGYVLDTFSMKCVKPFECPCHHGGRSYKENATIKSDCNTCRCQNGKWVCTDHPCSAECSAWGDSHFKTFDGKHFDFQGQCDYMLAKGSLGDDSFEISIQNVQCGTLETACSKSVTILVKTKQTQDSITLTRDMPLPSDENLRRVTLREVGLLIVVEAPDLGLVIHWDKGTRVYVKTDPRWKGRTMGLCGNYNDNEADDFQTPSSGISEVSAKIFGNSWKLQSRCPEPIEITNTCEEKPDRKVWATKKCGILKSPLFAPCHSEVPVDGYLEKCVFDSCACDQGGDCECLCTALAAYAQECNNKGVPIKWRSQQLCPIQCDERCTSYDPCISTCPVETCDDLTKPRASKICHKESCIEGCAPKPCPPGHIYRNSSFLECIPIDTCKPYCLTIAGVTYREGELIEEDECHRCYCTRHRKECSGPPCPPETTVSVTPTTPTTPSPSQCDLFNPYTEHERDCRHFYACLNTKSGPRYVLKSCGPFEYYHPLKRECASTTLVEEIKPECKTDGCVDGTRRVECAIPCDRLCMFYSIQLKTHGFCKESETCESACVKNITECPEGLLYNDRDTCVPLSGCWCRSHEGKRIQPGDVYRESDCEICQCLNNVYYCQNECPKTLSTPTRPVTTPTTLSTGSKPVTPVTPPSPRPTPPDLCPEKHFTDIIEDDDSVIFNASSVRGLKYEPENARFGVKGTWAPSDSDDNPYLEIDLGRQEPVYGVKVKGSDEYITSYIISYSVDDSRHFYHVLDGEKRPQVFSGPVKSAVPVQQFFDNPLEAQIVRIHPLTWQNAISLKVELIGCEITPTITPTPTKMMCDESMGLDDCTMSTDQITVSSELDSDHSKENLRISSDKAWQPFTNTPIEFITFDFLEPRILEGLKLKGGPDGWVKAFKIQYSQNNEEWNSMLDKTGSGEREFIGSFDQDTIRRVKFDPPIQARYFKLIPTQWYQNIQMRVELYGCFKPYPTPTQTLVTVTQPSGCNVCANVKYQPLKSGECRCPSEQWWNGTGCDFRFLCPCVDGPLSYPVRAIYFKKDCSKCECLAGGVSFCTPKRCECESGLKHAANDKCECICEPCPDGTTLCPTSNTCIDTSLWCDGVSDCTDDELDCPTPSPSPKTPKPEICPEINCSVGYEKIPNFITEDCPKYICRKLPNECPSVSCPPNYSLIIPRQDRVWKRCPDYYYCYPLDATCKVSREIINTFDGSSIHPRICNHILARDLVNNRWKIALKKKCASCSRNLVIHHDGHSFKFHSDLTGVKYDGFVYTMEQAMKIRSHRFSIARIGNVMLFFSHLHEFQVQWNGQGDVTISTAFKLKETVDGLCGYFDGNPRDDKRKPDGTLAGTTVEFGDSWQDGSFVPCEPNTCPDDLRKKALELCQINHEVMEPCTRVINTEVFVARCVEKTCDCLQKAGQNAEECRCNALTDYVVECLTTEPSADLSDWRLMLDCPVTCKAPLVYHDCYRRTCEYTCDSIKRPKTCPKTPDRCFPGCYCPSGFVRKGDTCVKSSDCGDCRCHLFPHLEYVTYDENNFTVNTNCEYVMSRDVVEPESYGHKFQVLVTHEPCSYNKDTTCVGKVTVLYEEGKIEISRDAPRERLKLDVVSSQSKDRVQVVETVDKNYRILLTDIKVEITVYYPGLGVSVKAPSQKYAGKLEGLCGNCDNDPKNDFTSPSGIVIRDKNEFALSWLYGDQNEEECTTYETHCPPLVEDPCDLLLDENIFGRCHRLLEPDLYLEWCRKDTCDNHPERACTSIEAYANQCAKEGFCIDWRKNICPKSCPVGMVHKPCGPACPKTCESIKEGGESCPNRLVDGCFCPEGKVLLNDTCVEETECEVCDDEGHHPGDKWKKGECTTCSCEGTSLQCETEVCPFPPICQEGFETVKKTAKKGSCCPTYECIQKGCIVNGNLMHPNETWMSEDGCTTFACDDTLTLIRKEEKCPLLKSCPTENIHFDGCCRRCNMTSPEQKLCAVEEVQIEKTRHLIQINDCKNEEPIPNFTKCKGTCSSSFIFNKEKRMFEKECSCCHPVKYTNFVVELQCSNGDIIEEEVSVPTECQCIESCSKEVEAQ